jgi:hypothetical protein
MARLASLVFSPLNFRRKILDPASRSRKGMAVLEIKRSGSASHGDRLDKIEVEMDGQSVVPAFIISDTRLQISLRERLAPLGGMVLVRIDYHYTIPGSRGGRTAVTPSSKEDIFEIAQWFPRMAVYDDLRGWDTLPYLHRPWPDHCCWASSLTSRRQEKAPVMRIEGRVSS